MTANEIEMLYLEDVISLFFKGGVRQSNRMLVLLRVLRFPGLSVSDLAKAAKTSNSNLSGLIDDLRRRGFITTERNYGPNGHDKSSLVHPTEKALNLFNEVMKRKATGYNPNTMHYGHATLPEIRKRKPRVIAARIPYGGYTPKMTEAEFQEAQEALQKHQEASIRQFSGALTNSGADISKAAKIALKLQREGKLS